jgi:signal transduction histidine kinase
VTEDWLEHLDTDLQRGTLLEVIALSAAMDDLAGLSQAAAALLARISGSDRCVVHVLDQGLRRLTVAGTWPPGDTGGSDVLLMGAGLAGWAASHGRAAVSVDVAADPRAEGTDSLCASAVSAPIGVRGAGLHGVATVSSARRREFTAAEVAVVVGIARLLAPSVAAARHHEHLHAREVIRHRSTEEFIALQEKDRRQLAAEVHDGVGQRIVGLSFHVVAAAESLSDRPEFAAEQLATARELADLAQAEVRSAVYGLRPPLLDDLGLADALVSLGRRVPGLDVDVRVSDQFLADHVATSLYRIAQEALQNVAKHSGADRATVELFTAGRYVVLRVTDDGEGFDADDGVRGEGLTIMRERAELDLVSRRGVGTTMAVRMPLTRGHPAQH